MGRFYTNRCVKTSLICVKTSLGSFWSASVRNCFDLSHVYFFESLSDPFCSDLVRLCHELFTLNLDCFGRFRHEPHLHAFIQVLDALATFISMRIYSSPLKFKVSAIIITSAEPEGIQADVHLGAREQWLCALPLFIENNNLTSKFFHRKSHIC